MIEDIIAYKISCHFIFASNTWVEKNLTEIKRPLKALNALRGL